MVEDAAKLIVDIYYYIDTRLGDVRRNQVTDTIQRLREKRKYMFEDEWTKAKRIAAAALDSRYGEHYTAGEIMSLLAGLFLLHIPDDM